MSSIWLAGHGLTQSETTIDYPRPDRLVAGNPKRITQSLYEHPNMNCGIWTCEVGAWNIQFAANKQEFFQVIEGRVRLHDAKLKRVKLALSRPALLENLKSLKPLENILS